MGVAPVNQPEIGVKVRLSGSDELRQDLRRVGDDARESLTRATSSTQSASSSAASALGAVEGTVGGLVGFANRALGAVGGVLDGVANAAGTAITKVAEIGGAFGAVSGIAGAGFAGLIYGARTYTQSVAEGASASKDFADSLGIGSEAFSRMQAAVRVNYGDSSAFGDALIGMRQRIVQLAEGTQSAVDAFGNLTLEIGDFRDGKGNLKGTREALDLVLDKIKSIANPTTQANAVMAVFGKGVKDLGGLVTEGAAAFAAAEKDVEKYGTVLDKATSEKLENALEGQGKLGESLRGLGVSLTKVFFPFFTEASTGLSKFLDDKRKDIETFLTTLRDAASRVKDDVKNLFGDLFQSEAATEAKVLVRRVTGGVGTSSSSDDEEEDDEEEEDEDEPDSASGTAAARTAIIDGKTVDLDEKRAENGEIAVGREAIINGKRVSLLNEAAQASEESGRRIAFVDGQKRDLDKSVIDGMEVNNARYAIINGERIELASRSAKSAVGRGLQTAFSFPIFANLSMAIRGIGHAAQATFEFLSSKTAAAAVGTVVALGNVAYQTGQAFLTLAGYVTTSLTGGAVAAISTFRGLLDAAASGLGSFRRGLRRGFEAEWARDLKTAADNVLATIRNLAPLAQPLLTALGAMLAFASGRAAVFSGWLRSIPDALTGLAPAVERASDAAWKALQSFAVRTLDLGLRIRDSVGGAWLQVVAMVAGASPRLAGLLEDARQAFLTYADGAIEAGSRIASGLMNAVAGERLQVLLTAAGEVLDGFLGRARAFGERLVGSFREGWQGVYGYLGLLGVAVALATGNIGIAMTGLVAIVGARFASLRGQVQDQVGEISRSARGLISPASITEDLSEGIGGGVGRGVSNARSILERFADYFSKNWMSSIGAFGGTFAALMLTQARTYGTGFVAVLATLTAAFHAFFGLWQSEQAATLAEGGGADYKPAALTGIETAVERSRSILERFSDYVSKNWVATFGAFGGAFFALMLTQVRTYGVGFVAVLATLSAAFHAFFGLWQSEQEEVLSEGGGGGFKPASFTGIETALTGPRVALAKFVTFLDGIFGTVAAGLTATGEHVIRAGGLILAAFGLFTGQFGLLALGASGIALTGWKTFFGTFRQYYDDYFAGTLEQGRGLIENSPLGGIDGSTVERALSGPRSILQAFVGFVRNALGQDLLLHTGTSLLIMALSFRSWGVAVGGVLAVALGLWRRFTGQVTDGQQKLSAGLRVQTASYVQDEGEGLIQKTGLPVLAMGMGFWGGLAARLFGAQMRLISAEIGLAVSTLSRFATMVGRIMTTVGQRLGLVGAGSSVAAGAGIVALAVAVGYATGAFAALQAVLILVALGLSLTFYAVAISAFSFKLFADLILFTAKALQIFFATSVVVLGALRVAFFVTFGAIRAAAVAFWAFMALSPLTMIVGIGLIVTALAVAAVLILRHFGVLGTAWEILTSAMVGIWDTALNAMKGGAALFQDWYEEGFLGGLLKVSSVLFGKIWQDFLNLGIFAINKLFALFGVEKRISYKGGQEDLQKDLDEKRKELGVADDEGNDIPRQANVPGMPSPPLKRAVVDANPGADPNDIISGSDGVQRPKIEEMRRLLFAEKARYAAEKATYDAEVRRIAAVRQAEAAARREAVETGQPTEGPGFLESVKKKLGGFLPSGEGVEDLIGGLKRSLLPGGEGAGEAGGGLGDILRKLIPGGTGGEGGEPPTGAAPGFDIEQFIKRLVPQVTPQQEPPRRLMPGEEDTRVRTASFSLSDLLGGGGGGDDQKGRLDALREQFPRWTDDELANEIRREDELRKEEEAAKPKVQKAGLDLDTDRLVRGLTGLGGGLDRRTDFTQGVPQDLSEGTGARGRPIDPLTGRPAAAGQEVVAANVTIKPGDKRLFGNREAIADLIKGLTDLGLDATADQARAT